MPKRWIVYPRTKNAIENGLITGKGKKPFTKGQIIVKDPALAREIDTTHGLNGGSREVYVMEDERYGRHVRNDNDEIHNYFFSGVDMPKKKKPSEREWYTVGNKQLLLTPKEARERGLMPEVTDAYSRRKVPGR